MTHQFLRIGFAFATAVLGATIATADTIYLIAGDVISDVKITADSFKEIGYKDGSKKKTVKTDKVLKIEFSAKSAFVDSADAAASEGQFYDAIGDLETYLDGTFTSGRRPRYVWEPAYAMYRLVELNRVVGDAEHLIAAVDQLLEKAPESRYVPMAYLAKAETEYLTGKGKAAKKTLDAFKAVIQGKSLSDRWQIEQKLASVVYDDSLKGKALRSKLEAISKQAGSMYPIVGNRADVRSRSRCSRTRSLATPRRSLSTSPRTRRPTRAPSRRLTPGLAIVSSSALPPPRATSKPSSCRTRSSPTCASSWSTRTRPATSRRPCTGPVACSTCPARTRTRSARKNSTCASCASTRARTGPRKPTRSASANARSSDRNSPSARVPKRDGSSRSGGPQGSRFSRLRGGAGASAPEFLTSSTGVTASAGCASGRPVSEGRFHRLLSHRC